MVEHGQEPYHSVTSRLYVFGNNSSLQRKRTEEGGREREGDREKSGSHKKDEIRISVNELSSPFNEIETWEIISQTTKKETRKAHLKKDIQRRISTTYSIQTPSSGFEGLAIKISSRKYR
jgi:hypothetical protein